MAKDPAFLFYPGDWMGGTMHLNWECKGAYMDILMLQFNRGHVTMHMIGQILGQKLDEIWPMIKDKFQTDGTIFWNDRLKKEKEKRETFTASRRNNVSGKNQHSDKDKKKEAHMTNHMEDENRNKDLNTNKNKKGEAEKVFEEVTSEFNTSDVWKTDLIRIYKKDQNYIEEKLKEFLNDLKAKDDLHKGFGEIKKHFVNWLKKEIEKEKVATKKNINGTGKQATEDRRQSVANLENLADAVLRAASGTQDSAGSG